jgi:protein gp37
MFETAGGIMADRSAIEWTEATWNPVTGCDRVSTGCDHCYAMTLAKRLKAMGSAKYQNDGDPRTSGPGFGVTVHPQALDEPHRWRQPRVVFVNSMSDLSVRESRLTCHICPVQEDFLGVQQMSHTDRIGAAA